MLIDICIKFREYCSSGFKVIERTQFVTDRQTDGQTDGRPGKNNMSPELKGGRHNKIKKILSGKQNEASTIISCVGQYHGRIQRGTGGPASHGKRPVATGVLRDTGTDPLEKHLDHCFPREVCMALCDIKVKKKRFHFV